ncbi:MAG: ribosome maturation factor RimM [Burkholderiales bacterium]|nr:ribosome maturation factor RimM [Burkholderiales bacterium]
MGRIVAPYGLKGWVRIEPYSAVPGSLSAYPSWWVGSNGNWREMKIAQSVLQHGASLVARFEGVVERDAALALKGSDVALERDALPPNEGNEFYWADLVGLKVMNLKDEELGAVAGLFDNGAHPVMRVVEGGNERLLPFVEQVVRQVDMAQGRIRVEWELDW